MRETHRPSNTSLDSRRDFLFAGALAFASFGCDSGPRHVPEQRYDRRAFGSDVEYRMRDQGMGVEIDFRCLAPGDYIAQAVHAMRGGVRLHSWSPVSSGLPLSIPPRSNAAYAQFVIASPNELKVVGISAIDSAERRESKLAEAEAARRGNPCSLLLFTANGIIERVDSSSVECRGKPESMLVRAHPRPAYLLLLRKPEGSTEVDVHEVPVGLNDPRRFR